MSRREPGSSERDVEDEGIAEVTTPAGEDVQLDALPADEAASVTTNDGMPILATRSLEAADAVRQGPRQDREGGHRDS